MDSYESTKNLLDIGNIRGVRDDDCRNRRWTRADIQSRRVLSTDFYGQYNDYSGLYIVCEVQALAGRKAVTKMFKNLSRWF